MSSQELEKQRSGEQLKKQQSRDELQKQIMGGGGGEKAADSGYTQVVGRMRAASLVQHTGWLVKQGDLMPTWKKRFFVLESKQLRWYNDEATWKAGKKAKGEITVVAVYRNAENPDGKTSPAQSVGSSAGSAGTSLDQAAGKSKEHGVRPKVVVHSLEGRLMLVRADGPPATARTRDPRAESRARVRIAAGQRATCT